MLISAGWLKLGAAMPLNVAETNVPKGGAMGAALLAACAVDSASSALTPMPPNGNNGAALSALRILRRCVR